MPPLSLRRAAWIALGALGVFSQLAQGTLGRELLVVFAGNEVSLGAFYGAWLAWIGIGALGVAAATGRIARPARLLVVCLVALAAALAGEIEAARQLRALVGVPRAELVPLGALVAGTVALTAPTGLLLGAAFPLACQALADEGEIRRLYVVEAVGALVGGALFTYLIAPHLGAWRGAGVSALLLGVAAVAVATAAAAPRLRVAGALVAAAGLAIAATPLGGAIAARSEAARWRTLHPGMELLFTAETRAGHLALGRLGGQLSIAWDGRLAASFPDPVGPPRDAAYFLAQADGARRVLLLGGETSGLVEALLRAPLERLDVVVADREAFARLAPYLPAASRAALADPRVVLRFDDPRRLVNTLPAGAAYDLVLVLTPEPSNAEQNRLFTRELYARAAVALAPRGVLCTRVSSAINYLGPETASYSGSVLRTLGAVLPRVVVTPGETHTLCASRDDGPVTDDGAELVRRARAWPAAARDVAPEELAAALPPEAVAFVKARLLAEPAEINTDLRPVTYYLNMILWGRFTSSRFTAGLAALRRAGAAPLAAPLLAVLGVFLLGTFLRGRRATLLRHGAGAAVAALGFAAMAGQVIVLYAYQAQVGFVYARIALLGGVFMAGLAVGAGLIGGARAAAPRAPVWLAAVLAAVAAVAAALPAAFALLGRVPAAAVEPGFLALNLLLGLLTGAGFPLAVAVVGGGAAGRTSGLVGAADHLGGAIGGFLAGGFLVPLLGTPGACRLVAVVVAVAALPLLRALLLPSVNHLPVLAARGRPSFPWPRLSLVLLGAGAALVATRIAVGPTRSRAALRFGDAELAQVSGSTRFTRAEAPFPHAVGEGGAAAPARTVTVASLAAAPDVRGYGGPINLLVALDETGRLRGVRQLESRETPAYLVGLDRWLAGLAGRDLTTAPLTPATVDAITGASVTRDACLHAIDAAARAGARAAFGLELPGGGARPRTFLAALATPRALAVAALLLLFIPVYWSGRDRLRLGYQVLTLGVLGVWLNTLVTEADLGALVTGAVPDPAAHPAWALLAGFVVLSSLLLGQVYCGYVCPFGALQELVSRAGRLLGLRAYAHRHLETRARYLKYVLLVLLLAAALGGGAVALLGFDPMAHAFHGWPAGWALALVAVSLASALVYVRFWCRYFCPLGALLALGNKVALLRRFAPRRRVARCDLGVRTEHDLDCLQCNRCVDGTDLGVRRRRRPRS